MILSPPERPASMTRRHLLSGAAGTLIAGSAGAATAADTTIKIGVLTDMSGPYKDLGGPNVVTCVRQAVLDFNASNRPINVDVLFADHQNKPDVGSSIARQWLDRDGVDCIADINNSAVAIALTGITRERDKVQLNTGAGSSDIIGKYCTPNLVHWTFDSWQITHATCVPMVERGGKTWFFITADYTFGHSTERDATGFITKAGGKVIGSALYPFPETSDFSSMIVQAQSSGAQVLGLATSGSDNINVIKQAAEFGLSQRGMQIAGLGMYINDVHALGLETSQGLVLSEMFYWDHNDRTRAFSARVQPKMNGVVPNHEQAGGYSGVFNYLRAVNELGVAKAKQSGRAVIEVLKRMALDDDALGPGTLRADGQALHPAYLHQVKSASESKGPWDYYKLLATVPSDQAFRPMSEEECKLGKS
jgi:branched-chain amino acid transport system substrate-binding protein